MTIHAYTETGISYTETGISCPAYINLSEPVAKPGDVIVTVRSAGANGSSSIFLTRDQLRNLVNDAQYYLDSCIEYSFDQFVQHGRESGGNIVNNMPWSFTFRGRPVTHENDRCYMIMGTPSGWPCRDLRLTPDDVLVVGTEGQLSVEEKVEPV